MNLTAPHTSFQPPHALYIGEVEQKMAAAEAERHLSLLDAEAGQFTFQTFDDHHNRKDPNLTRMFHGLFREHLPALVELNRRGAGIFVTVNETDGAGRKRENIIRIRAVWQEDDGEGKELPLKPHFIVETSPGKYHRYLLVAGLANDDHRAVQDVLSAQYGSDPNAKDVSRVLRLAGFYHQKAAPFLVRIISENPMPPYPRDVVQRSFDSATAPVTFANNVPAAPEGWVRDAMLATVNEKTMADIGSALAGMNPERADNYHTWIYVLMALASLKTTPHESEAFRLALVFSQRCPQKFDFSDLLKRWEILSPDRVTFKSIFKLAKEDGWINPRTVSVVDSLQLTLSIGSDVEISKRIGGDLINQYGEFVVSEGCVWRYIGTHWEVLPSDELRRTVHRYDGATSGEKGVVKLGKSRVDSILYEFMAMHDNSTFFVDAQTGINCFSGFIKVSKEGDITVEEHSPEQRSRHVIEASYPPQISNKVGSPSLLDHLLCGCFKGDSDAADKISLLGEIAGAAALGKGSQLMNPKAVVLKGVTAENGKSQVLDLFRGLLPPAAVSAITLGKMGDDRFVCGLAGKHLNASDELTSAAAVASDAFKQLITGEPITARDVYRAAITFRPIAQHIYATNELPSFKGGMDRGVQRRLLVLTFNRTIPQDERIDHIGQRIAANETDLLLEWAVNGAQRLLRQGSFTEPQSSKAALRDWLFGSDPVLAWLDQAATLIPNAETETRIAYDAFRNWAILEGYRENTLPAINTFTARVPASDKGITYKRTSNKRLLIGLYGGLMPLTHQSRLSH